MAKNSNMLSFVTPPRWWGEKWREGLYAGNGRTGANVYGGATEERVLINDSSLYRMGRTTVVPDVSEVMPEVVNLVNDGEFLRAQKVIPDALAAKNFRPQAEYPLPLAELNLHLRHNATTSGYRRVLDMERGVATVSYNVGGTKFVRDLFVSRTDDAVVYRLSKNGNGAISCTLTVELPHRVNARTYEGVCEMPDGVTVTYDKQFVCFAARNDDTGADYGMVCKISPLGGTMRAETDRLLINNAQQVLIVVKTFVGSRDKKFAELKLELASMRDGFEKMLKEHAAVHAKLFNSALVRLNDGADKNVEELLAEAECGHLSPELCEKLYKFARYLFVCGTCDDGRLFTPTGLWNGSYKPYRSFLTFDGQMQTSYLFALQGNMYQGLDKTFDNFDKFVGDYKNNAQRIFNCRGVVVPVVQAPKTGRLGTTDVFGVHFSGAAAWLCNFYYRYVKVSGNTRFLRSKLLPFMKEVALFYIDFVHVNDDGNAEIVPSPLPMRLGDGYKLDGRPIVAKNSILDFELCRDLLTNLVEACQTLGVKVDDRWQKLLSALPKPQTGSDGAMKEFVNSIIGVDYTGVSNGTLYSAYFGQGVNLLSEEDETSLYKRTADRKRSNPAAQNSFNTAVLASVYARLGLADETVAALCDVVRGTVTNNLVMLDKDWRGMGVCGSGVWSPVQLTSNLVFANAVQQMLLYCCGNYVNVFPAVPSDWHYVEFRDMACDNGVTVSAIRDDYKGQFKVCVSGKKDFVVKLQLPAFVRKPVKCNIDEKPEGNCFELKLQGSKAVELTYKIPQIKRKNK